MGRGVRARSRLGWIRSGQSPMPHGCVYTPLRRIRRRRRRARARRGQFRGRRGIGRAGRGRAAMTYCLAVKVDEGLVLLSDTRTNAGLDDISRFRKMFVWEQRGERAIVLL